MSVVWVVIGTVWLVWGWRTLRKLQEIQVTFLKYKVMLIMRLSKVEKWRVMKKENQPDKPLWEGERFKFFYCF